LWLAGSARAVFVETDIGQVGNPQFTQTYALDDVTGEYTVYGGGDDIFGTEDEFHFVYDEQPLSGDAVILARVTALQQTHGWSKAGVMIRDELVDISTHGTMLVSGTPRTSFQYRPVEWGVSTAATTAGIGDRPYWVKLTRFGDVLTGYHSPDGETWTRQGSVSIPMTDPYVGMAVTSHDNTQLAEAKFDNVTIARAAQEMVWNGSTNRFGSDNWNALGAWPDAATTAVINAGRVNVVEDQGAFGIRMGGGTLSVGASTALDIVANLDAAAGTVMLADESELSFEHGGGSIGTLSIAGTATVIPAADMSIAKLRDGGTPAVFVKDGGSTVTLGDSTGSGVTAHANTVFEIASGTLKSFGPNPLGSATTLLLGGGTFSVADGMTPPGTIATVPVGHWSFDDGSGNTARNEVSPGVMDGVLQGFPLDDSQWVEGKLGTALQFDGVDDDVEIFGYKGIGGTAARTVTAWIKTTADNGPIVAWGENVSGKKWVFRTQTGNGLPGAIRTEVNGGHVVGGVDVRDDQWHHVATVVPDGVTNVNGVQLYVDGLLQTRSSIDGQAMDTNDVTGIDMLIGADMQNRRMTGTIDDVQVFDVALTGEQIQSLSGTKIAPNLSPLRVTVNQDSAIEAATVETASFGPLSLQNGILTTSGTAPQIAFAGTTIPEGATAVGIDPQIETDYGVVNGGQTTAPFVFSKAGAGELTVEPGFMTNMQNATIDAADGLLRMTEGVDSFGGATAAQLSGGTLSLMPGLSKFNVLFMRTGANLNNDETGFVNHIESRADAVFTWGTVRDSDPVPAGYEDEYDLLFISSDSNANQMNKYADTTIPVVMSKSGMINKEWNFGSSGHNEQGTKIEIVNDAHPLAAGLSGVVDVYTSSQNMSDASGTNAPGMEVIGVNPGSRHPSLFVFEQGAELTDGSAASSRQVYMFYQDRSAHLTDDGWKLIDTAVNYALDYTPGLVPLEMTTIGLTATPEGGILESPATPAHLGTLTVEPDGVLTTSGQPISFTGVNFGGDAEATFAIESNTETLLTAVSGLDAADRELTVEIGGSARTIVDKPGSGLANTTFELYSGELVALIDAAGTTLADAELDFRGGGLILSSTGGDQTFDRPLVVSGAGTLGAAEIPGGVAGATLTYGSADNGATLTGNAVLALSADDGYTLNVDGAVSGAGGLRARGGTVNVNDVGAKDYTSVTSATAGTMTVNAPLPNTSHLEVIDATMVLGADVTTNGGVIGGLEGRVYIGGARDTTLIDGIGDGTGTGGLLGKAPSQSLVVTEEIALDNDVAFQTLFSGLGQNNDYQTLFIGQFTAPETGTYEFGTLGL